jgi:hypothetical protein
MRNTASLSNHRGGEQVEDMMEQGIPFSEVEDVIEAAHLPSDHKAALWLLAWSLRDRDVHGQVARLMTGSRAGWGRG